MDSSSIISNSNDTYYYKGWTTSDEIESYEHFLGQVDISDYNIQNESTWWQDFLNDGHDQNRNLRCDINHYIDGYHDAADNTGNSNTGSNSNSNNNNNNNNSSVASSSTSGCKGNGRSRWSEDERRLFRIGLEYYGPETNDWKNIVKYFVKTRTTSQVSSHAQKFRNRNTDKQNGKVNQRSSIHDEERVDDYQFFSLYVRGYISYNVLEYLRPHLIHDANQHRELFQLTPNQILNLSHQVKLYYLGEYVAEF